MPSPKPTKKKEQLMTLPQALNQLIDGRKITRKEWDNTDEYGLLRAGMLQIHTKGAFHVWMVSEADLVSIDWIVIPESN